MATDDGKSDPRAETLALLEEALAIDERLETLEQWMRRGGAAAGQGAHRGKPPWWRRTGLVTILAALVASVPPVTAGIGSLILGRQAQRLTQEQARAELRERYVDKAISEGSSVLERQLVFEFLVNAFAEGDPLHDWAVRGLEIAAKDLETETELATLRLEIAALEQERDSLLADADAVVDAGRRQGTQPADPGAAEARVDKHQEVAALESRVGERRAELGRKSAALSPRAQLAKDAFFLQQATEPQPPAE